MNRRELINAYLEFFKKKNHAVIENASLIPKEDPTVLFTTAGMHPLVPFLLGQKHPQGKRLVNVQRCIRTSDIDEVGDETHHTFFEMLGNWSLGDYGKKESITYSLEFLERILKISKEKITVSCFAGDSNAPKDTESEKIWKSLGIKKIKFLSKKDNWWDAPGETGPCGPDTEIFVNGIEIWNNVFMQYEKTKEGKYHEAKQKNVDTGMGVERTIAIIQNTKDNYETDVWKPIIEEIEKHTHKKYNDHKKEMRIIADHLKAATFIIADGITPSNKEQGYVLRRLIRRAVTHYQKIGQNSITNITEPIFEIYADYALDKNNILSVLRKEESDFNKTLQKGLIKFRELIKNKEKLSGKDTFLLFQSYGFPFEMTRELAKEKKIVVSEDEFKKELEAHQQQSKTASKGRFASGLADHSEKTTRLHTATHLLLAALRKILNDKTIIQRGSNITHERLRFDFAFNRKLEKDELKKTEDLINKWIQQGYHVTREEMKTQEALKTGALGAFGERYPKIVSVYTIKDVSKEICSGPHVANTRELGHFKILKEESSSAGVRRIKAILE